MRIRTVIFGVYVSACAVGFAVLMWFMLAEVRPRYVSAVRANLQDSATALARALDGRTTEQAVAALGRQASYQVRLVAADGRELFTSAVRPDAAGITGALEGAARSTRGTAKRIGGRILDGTAEPDGIEVATAASFVTADGQELRLVLSRSFRSMNAVVWAERRKLAGIALLIAGIMVVAGWWLAVQLTQSLERLTHYAQQVRDGQAAPVPASRAREIAALGQAFEEMREALEGRQHVERYTQTLAHEVKAPLAAIRGAAELMDEDMPPEQRRKFLGNIRTEAARIQQLIERLLELSSLEARKALGRTEPLAATDLLCEAADVVRPVCTAARVTLVVEAAPDVRWLRGERVLLREALVNLLQNALEFSSTGGEVRLACEEGVGGGIAFIVEDRGPGVPDYALPRVFEKFYSLPRPGGTRKSTGLGLTLVREIAHLHGGAAELANRPGGGARATLRLPLVG